jgi:penicillin-insensitive murein endopeptidase
MRSEAAALAFASIVVLGFCLALEPAAAEEATKAANPWAAIAAPAAGSSAAIGGYSAGCVRGAGALPDTGPGFQLARPSRQRHYGHPLLIEFLTDLGAAVKRKKLGRLLVADLGQPRGGPAPNGHSSHQSGLDVDVWYWHPRRNLPAAAREKLDPRPIVSLRRKKKNRLFNAFVAGKLELAARDRRVARIFVNPLIKRELCRTVPAKRRGWLRKLRPWWGHHEHFHVRLECPADSPHCEPQAPLAAGDGCAEIDWWLDEARQAERKKRRKTYRKRVWSLPEMPAACEVVLGSR